MKKLLIVILFFVSVALTASAQGNHVDFVEKSLKTNNTGMMVLGGWALANMAYGAYGWANFDGQQKYFNQMNFFWNTVNLSIAGIALYNNFSTDYSLVSTEDILSNHLKTERILLINSALDVGYIGTGFLLRYLGTKSDKRTELLRGYGNSLILQGSFLLVFDLAFYAVMHSISVQYNSQVSFSISPRFYGLNLAFRL
ncbi:MAG: hypothetical protein K9H26_05320 [Prolixibacteraceae bacterium]|nr:hypothetical protein [Prolixibacteraceae bacterium]